MKDRVLTLREITIEISETLKKSSVIDTGVREQLVNKVFLGNPSQQSAQMVFGCSKSELPLVNGVGAGIISIDGKEPKT
ncbi:MAG: hypothetical protein ABF526_11880, partial [Liquorilactobacillus nagelii]